MSDIVTVSGLPGSGTTTLCKILQEETNLPYVYAGQIFRAEAERRGMSLADFGKLCEQDETVDQTLDREQEILLTDAADGLILEGRLSGWLAQKTEVSALKVWVSCDEGERLRRIVERDGGDLESQRGNTLEREQSEADRYMRYYGIDLTDTSPYDLVLDSTSTSPEELANQLLAALRSD